MGEYCPSINTFCRPAAFLSTGRQNALIVMGSEISQIFRGRRNARFRPHPFHCYEGPRPRPKPGEPDAAPRDLRPLPPRAQPRPAGEGPSPLGVTHSPIFGSEAKMRRIWNKKQNDSFIVVLISSLACSRPRAADSHRRFAMGYAVSFRRISKIIVVLDQPL